jgi:hypothetical protein
MFMTSPAATASFPFIPDSPCFFYHCRTTDWTSWPRMFHLFGLISRSFEPSKKRIELSLTKVRNKFT